MCELMGLSFNVSVRPEISFKGFIKRGQTNPHGWGLGFYPDGRAGQVFKEPIEVGQSRLAAFLAEYQNLRSMIFIGHVRYANAGGHTHRNTHPFERIHGGKSYIFAHNGTLGGYKERRTDMFVRLGETDSEWAFCQILNWLSEVNVTVWSATNYTGLLKVLRDINGFGKLNVLMSDGEYLFSYHDKDCYKGLCYVRREFPFVRTKLTDDDWEIDFGKLKDPDQKGYVVATKPLTKEKWSIFSGGQLIVFKSGEIVYQ